MEVPYIALDSEIDPAVLAKKMFNSSVVSSNFPLRYVQVDILDDAGKKVTSKLKIDMTDSRKVILRNAFSGIFEELESGNKYTLVLSAGIAIDSCELQRVEFTLN